MFEKLLARLGAALDRHSIPYMIIGGQAVLLYGEPRLTRDIDVTLGIDLSSLDTLLAVVEELSLAPVPPDVRTFVQKTMVLPAVEEESGIRVDFILSFTPYEREAIARGKMIRLEDQEVRFASVEDVIIHKIFAGRPRDLEDVRLMIVRNRDIDREHILQWLKQFDASSDKSAEKTFVETFDEIDEKTG